MVEAKTGVVLGIGAERGVPLDVLIGGSIHPFAAAS